jgi:hypothetical protein
VRLAYIDESYDRSRLVLGVVMVDAASARHIREGLDDVVRDAHGRHGVRTDAEIHAHELIQGSGMWSPLRGRVRARIRLLNAAVEVVAASSASLVVSSVEPGPGNSPIASAVAVSSAYSRALQSAVRLIDDQCVREDVHVALIADDVVDQDLHRRSLLTSEVTGRSLVASLRASRLVDTLYFGPSHASRLLQAADICAYVFRREMATRGSDDLAARTVHAMADRLRGRLVGEAADRG